MRNMDEASYFSDEMFFKFVNPAIRMSYPPHAFKQGQLVQIFVMFID